MYKNEETLLTDVLGPRNDVSGSQENAIYLAIHIADLFESELDTIMMYDSAIMFLTRTPAKEAAGFIRAEELAPI